MSAKRSRVLQESAGTAATAHAASTSPLPASPSDPREIEYVLFDTYCEYLYRALCRGETVSWFEYQVAVAQARLLFDCDQAHTRYLHRAAKDVIAVLLLDKNQIFAEMGHEIMNIVRALGITFVDA